MNEVFEQLAQEPYEARGIIHSERALLLRTVRDLGIKRIIESGRARAQSTYLMGKYLPDVQIISIEGRDGEDQQFGRERVKDLQNVWLFDGDGRRAVPQIAGALDTPTAILLDGPKGAAAVDVLDRCFDLPHVLVGFIHDMRKLDHGTASPHRRAAIDWLPMHKFSDDPAWLAESSWMDAKVAEAGGPVGPQHEAEFGSYGPTLGSFLNHKQTATSEMTHELLSQAG